MRDAWRGALGRLSKPRPVNDNDLEAMRRIDALFTARPFYGARRIARTLTEDGFPIDRNRAAADAGDGDRGAGAEAAHQRSPIARRWPSGAMARGREPMDMWTTDAR